MKYVTYEVTMQEVSVYTTTVRIPEETSKNIDAYDFFDDAIKSYHITESMEFDFVDEWKEIDNVKLIENPADDEDAIILDKEEFIIGETETFRIVEVYE